MPPLALIPLAVAFWLFTLGYVPAWGQDVALSERQPTGEWLWLMPLVLVALIGMFALSIGIRRLGEAVSRLQEKDALTGLWLRSTLVQAAAVHVKDGTEPGLRSYAFMVTIDELDGLNGSYGVIAADEILIALSDLLRGVADTDPSGRQLVGRWSGNRFGGIFKAADDKDAEEILSNLRQRVDKLDMRFGGAPVSFSISTVFGALAGSRAEDVEAGFELVLAELAEKPKGIAGSIIEAPAPARQKRTFVRESDGSLART